MSLQAKFFSGLVVLMLAFFQTLAQHDDVSDVEWYAGFFYENKQEPVEDALARSTLKLTVAREHFDAEAEAFALKEIGLTHLTGSHNYDLAMDFLIRALTIEDSLNLREKQVFTFMAIAKVFEATGDHFKSAELLNEALLINEEFRDVNVLVLILNDLGKISAAMGKLESAFEHYEHVLKYTDQLEQPGVEAEALFNLANLYALQVNYPKALDHHKLALAIRRSLRERNNEALSLNAIGELYRLMKNDEKAIANHVVALEIRQELNDKKGIAESYNNIAVLYFEQKNYERAIANLQLALQAGQEAHVRQQIRISYEYLSDCYEALGDYKQALGYKDLHLAITEFIHQEVNEQKLLETQNLYILNKKQSQIEDLEMIRARKERELLEQKKFNNFLFTMVGLGLIIVALIFYMYLLKQRSNKILKAAHAKVNEQNTQLQELNATKDKFFSIISHDLKGPLNSFTSFSSLLINHTDSMSKEEIRMLAKDLDKSLKNLFALLENLLEWSRSQTGNIEFKPERFDLVAILETNKELLKAQAGNKKINIVNKAPESLLANAHKHSINTVVRNLMSNAIKFTPADGVITLDARQDQGMITVSVADTGVGMDAGIVEKLFRIDTKHSTKGTADEKGTGLGLILCKEFVEKNGGKIWVESAPGKGSVFYFTIPFSSLHKNAEVAMSGVSL